MKAPVKTSSYSFLFIISLIILGCSSPEKGDFYYKTEVGDIALSLDSEKILFVIGITGQTFWGKYSLTDKGTTIELVAAVWEEEGGTTRPIIGTFNKEKKYWTLTIFPVNIGEDYMIMKKE
jgi:hypothetical protein